MVVFYWLKVATHKKIINNKIDVAFAIGVGGFYLKAKI
jgi:hypothetical protein